VKFRSIFASIVNARGMDDMQVSGAYNFYRLNTLKGGLKTLSYQESIFHKHWSLTTEIWELCLDFIW